MTWPRGRPLKELPAGEVAVPFAQALRSLRSTAGLTQEQLATRLGCSRGYIAQWERAEKLPSEALLDELVKHLPGDARGLRDRWAEARAAQRRLGGSTASLRDDGPATFGGAPVVTAGWLQYVEDLRDTHARADSRAGGGIPLPLVKVQAEALLTAVGHVGSVRRERTLSVASQYAELCSWLHQDLGLRGAARAWADQALQLANETADPLQISAVYVRKSAIAGDAGDGALAQRFAEAAWRHEPRTPNARASAKRQLARAFALQRSYDACATALEHAKSEAKNAKPDDPVAPFATPEFVLSEGGACWLDLEDAGRAREWLEKAVAGMPSDEGGRDHVLCLSRLVRACALTAGGSGDAAGYAERLLHWLPDMTSARVVQDVQQTVAALAGAGEEQLSQHLAAAADDTVRRHGMLN